MQLRVAIYFDGPSNPNPQGAADELGRAPFPAQLGAGVPVIPGNEPMDRDQLRRRANHYRQLATDVVGEQMREGILKLAAEFEAEADAPAGEDSPQAIPGGRRNDGT